MTKGFAILVGAAMSLCILIYEHIAGVPVSTSWFERIMFACFLIAFYRTWNDERNEKLTAHQNFLVSNSDLFKAKESLELARQEISSVNSELAYVSRKNQPNLEGKIQSVTCFEQIMEGVLRQVVLVWVTVKNIPPSSPSVVDGWTVNLITSSYKAHFTSAQFWIDPIIVKIAGRSQAFNERDAVYSEKNIRPLAEGDKLAGVLIGISKDSFLTNQMVHNGTIEVLFRDILERGYSVYFQVHPTDPGPTIHVSGASVVRPRPKDA